LKSLALLGASGHGKVVADAAGWQSAGRSSRIGGDEMIVMLWANEIFDRQRPDTYACPL
jgi:UDP-2-acetamido-2,6-beta-L-arabino-hexul-4-ose reductase